MTIYEWVSLGFSLVALVVAIASWLKSKKLAKLQIQELEEKKRLKDKPKLNVAIRRTGKSSYFAVANTGDGSAYDLDFRLVDCDDSPIMDTSSKLPHPELKPNSVIKLAAYFHINSPVKYQVELAWQEKGSDAVQKEIFWVDKI